MIIAHNMSAANAERQLGIVGKNKARAMEKLSTGYKINRAADDAAGLPISEKMRAQIRGLTRGSTNAEDGMSLIQVADGALQNVHDVIHRIRELSVQAANDINTAEDRLAIQREVDCLLDEIDRIAENTEFNKKKLFKGDSASASGTTGQPTNTSLNIAYQDLWIQSGANDGQGITIRMGVINTTVLGLSDLQMSSHETAGDALNKCDEALSGISEMRGRLGAQYNGLTYAKANDDATGENLQMSESTLRDADMADEMVRFSTANILEQAGLSVLSQANSAQDGILQLLG